MNNIIQPVKGTRDFYPEQMAFRNWFYTKIKEVSEKFGYQEYDGPVLEYLDLYTDKTSEEILKTQAFTLKDRDNKTLILRPELTPTFARMVAQKSQQLLRPIRWFSFGRMWRYEQPQKGRGREAFQWEINLLGPENPEADAEIIAIAAEFFISLGLTPQEVVIYVSDRTLVEQFCEENNIPQEKKMPLIRFMDRILKISQEEMESEWNEQTGLPASLIQKAEEFIENKDYSKSEWLTRVFDCLEKYPGVKEYVEFNPAIFRGFDYYTRTIFEAWDRSRQFKRSLFGGGRFDNLTATIGGERIPGVGMAPGDMPMEEILKQFNKIPDIKPKIAQVLVTVFSPDLLDKSLEVASKLRSNNINTEVWLDPDSRLDKQLKYADQKGIPYAIIIGPEEAENGTVTLKSLTTQTQETLPLDEIISKLSS